MIYPRLILIAALSLLTVADGLSATRYRAPSYVPRTTHGRIVRSREVTREFQKLHPCPSTGRTTGACPGYVKDHVIALCAGGADAVGNLSWQTVAEAKAKDKTECRK